MHLQHNSEVRIQGLSQNMYGMIVRAKWKTRKFSLELSCRNHRETIPIIYEQYDYINQLNERMIFIGTVRKKGEISSLGHNYVKNCRKL